MERIESPAYARLGNSGLVVPSVGIGCNNLGRPGTPTQTQEGTNAVIAAAVEAGIGFFDIADLYGAEPGLSETMFGTAMRELNLNRDDLIIVTKFGLPTGTLNGNDWDARGSRRYIMRAVEGSLRRLGTEYIDLYFYHSPDPNTPLEETLSALDTLVTSGKVRYLGHSNFAGWQLAHAEHLARTLGTERFIAAENHYNLLDRRAELEILPAARHFGLGCSRIPARKRAFDRKIPPRQHPAGVTSVALQSAGTRASRLGTTRCLPRILRRSGDL